MWTDGNRRLYERRGARCPSDLTDTEWALIAPLIPPAKRGGRRRQVDVHEVMNGVLYVLERITGGNTVEMTVLYDAATGRPGSIAHKLGAATLASFGYGFDTDGKILSIADGGGTRDFTYDATQQVTGGGFAGAPESYAYDPEGNRTSSHLSASYTHDAPNRLREDADTCYDYDANATSRPGPRRWRAPAPAA